ncbi:MAG: hypothetical protein HC908_01720 [Calothrix sp. SM1_7_51]|nr:hypothetical protein [Calothrix sp. SM1_7_51]
MNNPLVQAFFVGRAVAEVLSERAESAFTDALSELGKMDAELKEQMRQFTEEVTERANRNADAAAEGGTSGFTESGSVYTEDTQATIDDLRAEIAILRNSLQNYRTSSGS